MTEPAVPHLHHVNICVDDLDAAVAFYEDVLGLEAKATPDLGFKAGFLRINESQEIHINELPDDRGVRSHFALRVPDFSATIRRALDAGCLETSTWGLARRLPGGVMQAFMRDPAGNLVEVGCGPDQAVDEALFELDEFDSEERFADPPVIEDR